MKTVLKKVISTIPPIYRLCIKINNLFEKPQIVVGNSLPTILKDDFIKRIKMGVIGWCPDSNIQIMDDCIRLLPEGAVIEIGSFCGLSTSVLSHCLRRYKKKNSFFSVDGWFLEGYDEVMKGERREVASDAVTGADWRDHTENMFKLTLKLTAKNVNHSHMKLNSDEFFTAWSNSNKIYDINGNEKQLGGDIAFAYIDGSHSYDQSKKDFLNVDKFLVIGGYVFFDDSSDLVTFGSRDVANEVAKMPNYKLVSPKSRKLNKCFIKIY